jgi:[glutamine synthetase] adenylyltransferase / [glutamine synthetase]-adenylyl-L-tyrosine phosphorylase
MQTLSEFTKNLVLSSQQILYLQKLESCSPFASRLLVKDADLRNDLLHNLHVSYELAEMQQFLETQKINDEASLKKALRKLRQRVFVRTIARDLNGLANLQEVMRTTSQLAECAINTAIDYLNTWLVETYGQPIDAQGYPQCLIVIGMGKLGGGELNVSSDIDLIFAYENEGETQSENPISNQDFFTRLGKKLIASIDEVTEDGFVFRVDMRLRPFGSEGALVSNLDALEEYYQNNGREWERYAWIKGRVIAGSEANIHALLRPFVFRKYLDYNAFASMRSLKQQIHRDVTQKGQQDNIKLGRGGIREIEFIAQVFQLIRGGQDVSLQIKPTLEVLKLLQSKGLLPESVVHELTQAYTFLRNLEHRLMYVEDQQTQDLPKTEEQQARIALAMNFKDWPAFLQALSRHRNLVQQHFDATFSDGDESKHGSAADSQEVLIWQGGLDKENALHALSHAGFGDASQVMQQLQMLRSSSRYQQLSELSHQRFDRLMPLVIKQSGQEQNSDVALLRAINLLENICRRANYLAMLAEYPEALHLVIKLCAASPWLAQYLTAHPVLMDELLDARNLYAEPDFDKMYRDLSEKMSQLQGDAEAQMDAMRHFKHTAILRFAAQDIAGRLTLERLSDYLSALADVILQVSLQTIWQSLKFKHCESPRFAVIGYGKLGGKELGYTSDLDIIFLYDDDQPEAAENYARFAQRINNWFNSLTNAGLLYETDLQLRPDGNSGLLVSSVEAFRDYQLNKAWVWEHQAITRARFVAGDVNIGKAFDAVRNEVMTQPRDMEKLKAEVMAMREKMRAAQHFAADTFDIKHSLGGIIDVEFLVQYLVLAYASKYPQLTENIGNISLLSVLGELKIVDKNLAKEVADAYREYRKLIHATKLQEQAAKAKSIEVERQRTAVLSLWKAVFGQDLTSPT